MSGGGTTAARPAPPDALPAALIDRRLILVTGKGGVGKSTVAAALAVLARRAGRSVKLDVVGGAAGVAHAAATGAAPSTDEPRAAWLTRAGVEHARLDGRASLDEYLGRVLPAAIHRRVIRSRRYRRFAAGAPGLAELMVLGKIADDARIGGWDVVVADVGATGHALQLIGMPSAAGLAFGAGRVRREVDRIRAELADPRHTALVAVATPEQLAVDEAIELVAGAATLGIAIGPAVINRVHRAPCRPDQVPAAPPGAAPLVVEALTRARALAARAAHDHDELARLRRRAPAVIALPELIADPLGPDQLDALVAALGGGT